MTKKDKVKLLEIEVFGGSPGPDGSLLFYGVPEESTILQGRVRFSCNYECKGIDAQYSFEGMSSCHFDDGTESTAHGEESLIDHVWQLPVIRPPGHLKRISPGRYEGKFKVDLDGSKLPSSSAFKRGKVEYTLEARISRNWSADIVQKQTIWFQSTTLPAIQTMPTIASITGKWKERLPYTIILPSDVLVIGQRVPITFRFGPCVPFLSDWKSTEKGGNALTSLNDGGDAIQFVNPRLRLKQYYRLSTLSTNTMDEKNHKRDVVDVELAHWPKSKVLDFEDTVLLQLPPIPELAPTTETIVYSVRHSLNLVTDIIGKNDVSGTMKIKVKVKITGPRPPLGWNPVLVKEGKVEEGGVIDEVK